MARRKLACPNGHCTRHLQRAEGVIGAEVGGKVGLAILGGILGGGVAKNPLAAVGMALLGAVIGHEFLDKEVLPNCPACGVALRLVNAAL